ncbi:MAG: hypothetical protein COZ75_09575 [Flavobacteriaceae bacterium CG_4_8_14_3_um_filter_34_10]|nr:hypothetical protein [Flavobacteriia bacterium]PIV51585.1 MAG: hypothetical protein COS19_00725 [Flavobacteriaceae bacterium CG02_land_8_20_14_3_00_34_13]PIX08909.1 MAG: hypothetical protein COZ75_09575 [Flavobacteriaceae bacterium CG_4_8_14_3_um_filter_34_10]
MKSIIKIFFYNFIWLLSFSSFSQEPIENYLKIKVTEIEEISDYYVYKVVKFEENIKDTIILLNDKLKIKNEQVGLLKLNSYYEVNYEEKVVNSLPILGGGAVFDIVDNVRIAELYTSPKIITKAKILHFLNENNSANLNKDPYNNFEDFLNKFINDDKFRFSRLLFSNTLGMNKKENKRNKKIFKNWGEFESILIRYKIKNYKRDKIYMENSSTIFFRIYAETLNNEFWYLFTLDREDEWQLSSFFKL